MQELNTENGRPTIIIIRSGGCCSLPRVNANNSPVPVAIPLFVPTNKNDCNAPLIFRLPSFAVAMNGGNGNGDYKCQPPGLSDLFVKFSWKPLEFATCNLQTGKRFAYNQWLSA